MGITFKAFNACVDAVTSARLPVMLRSRHGMGKSQVVYQYAAEKNLPVIERRASQMTEGDLLGLPRVSGTCTEWLPPEWLQRACQTPVLLFVDEIDRATTEVRQGFFELTDSRKVAGQRLHPDTLIFAAVNSGENAAQYQVSEMDPAEISRWVVFDLEPSVEDWLNWAKDKVDPIIWDFINTNQSHLEHRGDFEPNKVYPSRRSWHRFSDTLAKGDKILEPSKPNPVLYNLGCAFVGLEASVAFQDFVKNCKKMVTIGNLLDEGDFDLVKDWTISEHTAMVDKMVTGGDLFKTEMSENRIVNLGKYFNLMPAETAVKLFTDMSGLEIKNVVALHAQPGVKQRLVSFYTEEKKKEPSSSASPNLAPPATGPAKRGPGRPRKNSI